MQKFPSRSGTEDDQVYLCSPETAAFCPDRQDNRSKRFGKIYAMKYPKFENPEIEIINTDMLVAPLEDGSGVELHKGPNIKSIPEIAALQQDRIPILLKMGDNVSTDEILKAGADVLPK
jgi:aconitate hydratase